MKRIICLTLTLLVFTLIFSSCKKQAQPEPLVFQPASVTNLVLTDETTTVSINNDAILSEIIGAINSGSPIVQSENEQELATIIYRFTLMNGQNNLHTVTVYSAQFIQIDTNLYKGTFDTLIEVLQKQFKASEWTEIFQLFETQSQNAEEITFYHLSDNTYKVLSGKQDINQLFEKIKSFQPAEFMQNTNESKAQYKIYVRCADKQDYNQPLIISASGNQTTVSYGDKFCGIKAIDLEDYFNGLPYNIMP